MNNNLSDSDISDNTTEGDSLYKQFLHDISSGSIDFQPFIEGKLVTDPLKTNKTSSNSIESIAEKVKEDTISQTPIETTVVTKGYDNHLLSNTSISNKEHNLDEHQIFGNDIDFETSAKDPENLVREWESNNKVLSSNFRKIALHAATIHITKGKGITVSDLVDIGFGKDYTEKLLPQAVERGLLQRHENRLGKQHQYVLSNYIHILNSIDANKEEEEEEEVLPTDVSLLLAHELSKMRYVYHNIHLTTSINYKDDYHLFNWGIPSIENKQKVHTFTLEPKRSVTFIVSPNGTVNISIECTYHHFEFHTAEGLMNFFGICGQIFTYLQLCTKSRVNVVPSFSNWSLMQFDYNKDLPTKTLKDKYSSKVINWSSKGVLRVYYLGVIFRIYCKMMPYIGECLRAEGRFSTKEEVKISDSIPRITAAVSSDSGDASSNNGNDAENNKKHPFTTIEEMLLNRRGERDGVAVASKNKGKGEEL